MKECKISIQELATVNPHQLEDPPNWSRKNAERDEAAFRKAVESVLGSIRWFSDAGATTSQAKCSIPSEFKLVRENEFIGIILSKFSRLFTVTYSWDLKPECLASLVHEIERAGFRYVPVTLFADPNNFSWKYVVTPNSTNAPVPAGKNVMKHAEIWSSLFDYL